MKRLFILLSVTILLFPAFSFHCFGADTYTLKYNLETGKTYKQSMVTVMNMKMNVMGQDMNMDMNMEMGFQYNVIGQNNDVFDIQTTFQKIKMKMSSPMPFTIDTDSTENSTNKNLGDVFKSLIGVPIDIQLTQAGKVVSVQGADKLAEKFDAITNEQYKQMFGAQFSEKALQTTFERMSPYFPEKPVAIGDSWDITANINSNGVDIISKMKLTLTQVKDNIATMDCSGTLSTPEGGAVFQVQGMDATASITGDQTGTIQIDMKTGWIVRSELSQKFVQNIEVGGQPMQQNIESKTVVTGD